MYIISNLCNSCATEGRGITDAATTAMPFLKETGDTSTKGKATSYLTLVAISVFSSL